MCKKVVERYIDIDCNELFDIEHIVKCEKEKTCEI